MACTKPEPVQDPLDYLQVGVDPVAEADAIIEDLREHGFRVPHRIAERSYVAFDAARGADSMVRVITRRGPGLSLQVPDVRWPERLWVELGPSLRPDFDGDGQRDVVVVIRERDRVCLAWAQVSLEGFVTEVLRAREEWGHSPCLLEIAEDAAHALLEVSVPDSPLRGARVRIPLHHQPDGWALDRSAAADSRWQREIDARQRALEAATVRGDSTVAAKLRAELDWLGRLRKAEEPVLEAPEDGEEAR